VRCEVCGKRIYGKPQKVVIEGAVMVVCGKCAKHGATYHEPPKPKLKTPIKRNLRRSSPTVSTAKSTPKLEENLELVEGYGLKVRKAREKLGLSHEDLGRKIGEKVSVLKKIETEKMIPDNVLAKKLEHALQIKLLVEAKEPKIKYEALQSSRVKTLTLGDVANIKTRKSEDAKEREQ